VRSSPSTSRLPTRKSPWTTASGVAGGRLSSSQRRPSSKAGRATSSRSSPARAWSRTSRRSSCGWSSGGIEWMAASASPSCAASARRPSAVRSARTRRGPRASPATAAVTRAGPSEPASVEATMVAGTGTPAAAAAARRASSAAIDAGPALPPGRVRWRIRSRRPSGPTAVRAHVSRDAPPESRRSPSTVVAPPARSESTASRSAARSSVVTDRDPRHRSLGSPAAPPS
jgi:hypothetical protein